MKTPTKATAPESGKISKHLTNGKTYDIIKIKPTVSPYGNLFSIISDDGYELICLEKECVHLNRLGWKLS